MNKNILKIFRVSDVSKDVLETRWSRTKKTDLGVVASVKRIINEVKKRGDAALFDFTMKFDGVKLTSRNLRVNREEIERAYEKVGEEQISAVKSAKNRVGTNNVLPTGGFSRIFSGLSVLDFIRRVNVVECSKEGLSMIRSSIRILAESEGLMNHALAVEGRFGD